MVPDKSLDKYKLIAALLYDVHSSNGSVFNSRSLRLTLKRIDLRLRLEGEGFLTKTLPRLGKALDKALCCSANLNCTELGFAPLPGTKLPRFLGELFRLVLHPDGASLPNPSIVSVRHIRQICYLFYKYELPYNDEQKLAVINQFKSTEVDMSTVGCNLDNIDRRCNHIATDRRQIPSKGARPDAERVVREARILLSDLFAFFDPKDIVPRHGPGVVATKQTPWGKYLFTNVSEKITTMYPLDEYFYSSLGHICDHQHSLQRMSGKDLPAQVQLVPKDSRGPRLISCEPVDYQWIQQGLGRAIVELVETHDLTRFNVFFTDQVPNRIGALWGSKSGRYATLDLKEASDRVSLRLVKLLFPPHIYACLEACRSSATVLPGGEVLNLLKFAPMGSCLCFPIMALTIWAILTAGSPDTDTQESIHVYGDDVIVPTAHAANAIEQLETFGLKVNHDKSCTSGLFRESCGMDALMGADVTPVRLRTVWSSSQTPESYCSWIAYANSFYDRKYFSTYDYIVGLLHRLYGEIPAKDMNLSCPSLIEVPDNSRPKRRRNNKKLQKLEYYVRDVKSPSVTQVVDGWAMLLRFFSETGTPLKQRPPMERHTSAFYWAKSVGSVSLYTRRSTSLLVRRWR